MRDSVPDRQETVILRVGPLVAAGGMAGLMNRAPGSRDQLQMRRTDRIVTLRTAVRALIASVTLVATSAMAVALMGATRSAERVGCAKTFEAEVEVSKYSGLPNPRFVLRGDDAKTLWELLARPRELGWSHPIPTDVGLGGYQVAFVCPVQKKIQVMGEIIFTRDAEGGSFYDPDRDVHRYLTDRFHALAPSPWLRAPRAP